MLPGRIYTPLDFAAMARRWRWLVAASVIVGAYAGLIVSSRLVAIYQSEMLIQVVPQRVPSDFVRSTVTMGTENRLTTLIQQVLSRTALEALIRQMNLYPRDLAEKPLQDVIESMRKMIDVEPTTSAGQGAGAFYIRFSYPDPDVATQVTERLGALFIDLNARDRGDLALATDEFLESQLSETRAQLEEQERKLELFRRQNAGRLPTQLLFNMQAMQNTQMAIQALVESLARDRDRLVQQERLFNEAMSAPPASPLLPQVDGRPGQDGAAVTGTTTEQQLAAAREALARLRLRLKPEHPDVARTTHLIETLEERVKEELTTPADVLTSADAPASLTPEQRAYRERIVQMRIELDTLRRDIASKEAEEQRQRGLLVDYQSRIEGVPGIETEWIALTRDYDTQQAAYRDLLTKSEQSKVAVQLERRRIGEQFRVLDPARPPLRPIGIKRVQVNGIGALAGLVLGVLLAALMELRDTTFRNGDDVSQVLKLPVVALVPFVMTDGDRSLTRRRRLLASAAVVVLVASGAVGVWSMELWKYVV